MAEYIYKDKAPIVIHPGLIDRIDQSYTDAKNANDNDAMAAVGTYVYLYKTARYQGNVRVWMKDAFITKNGRLSIKKWHLIRKRLIELDLIELHTTRDSLGHITGWYIEVKHIWHPDTIQKLFYKEMNETTEYKIMKRLLISSFGTYYSMLSGGYDFNTELNDVEVELWAETFHFDDDGHLIAEALIAQSEDYEYIVPTDMVHEILRDIASRYTFSIDAIFDALNTKIVD